VALYDFNGENDGDLKLWWELGLKIHWKSQLQSGTDLFLWLNVSQILSWHLVSPTTPMMDGIFHKHLCRAVFNSRARRLLPLCRNDCSWITIHMKSYSLYRLLDVDVKSSIFLHLVVREPVFEAVSGYQSRDITLYYTTQPVRGPITKISQSKCSIAGPIFSKYRTGHCPEWSRTCVLAFFSRVINLLLTNLAQDRTGRISADILPVRPSRLVNKMYV